MLIIVPPLVARTHKVISDKHAVSIVANGELTNAELMVGVMAMRRAPDFPAGGRMLVDLGAVRSFKVTTQSFEWLERNNPLTPGARKAYVISSGFGQALVDFFGQQGVPEDWKIFNRVDDALAWLNEGCPPDQILAESDLAQLPPEQGGSGLAAPDNSG